MPVIMTLGLVHSPSRTHTAGWALNASVVRVFWPMYAPTGGSEAACKNG
jgi:hypothetical protein